MDTAQLSKKLAGGIPGAIELLVEIERWFHHSKRYDVFLRALQHTNIKGSAIWMAVYEWHHGSIQAFIEAVERKDPALLNFLKSQGYKIYI